VTLQVNGLGARLSERGVTLQISPAALDHLGESGFDPLYGARPLKRAIQSQLENPLASQLLAGRYPPGSSVEVSVEGGVLVFKAPTRH